MKVVILAGGFGSRISEYSTIIPKPMIPIGGKPILWHIMKRYAYLFIICHKIGFPPMGIIGFGIIVEYSEIRLPNPPAKITTFTSSPLKKVFH